MRDKNEECNCGVAARSRDTTEPCPAHAKQTYGQYLASFITGPEPVAPPAGDCSSTVELSLHEREVTGSNPVSPTIGDVEKLIERLEAWDYGKRNDCSSLEIMSKAAAMLRSLADEKASYVQLRKLDAETIAALRAEKARVEEELETEAKGHAEMCAFYDKARIEIASLRAEKASLIAQVNDMATMVNEARDEKAKIMREILAARFDANALRAEKEKAERDLYYATHRGSDAHEIE